MIYKSEETNIQVAVANHLRYYHPNTCFTTSPSGLKLPVQIGGRMKAMGYRAGTPDLLIFEPRGRYHGLFIELKTEKGTIQPNQRHMLDALELRGYRAVVCFGYEVTIEFIDQYLKML